MQKPQPLILDLLRKNLDVLKETLSFGTPSETRSEMSRRVCERFSLLDAKGRFQTTSTLVALKVLEKEGQIALPPSQRKQAPTPATPGMPPRLPEGLGLPADVSDLIGLRVERVETAEQRELWKSVVSHEHPFGARKLVGRQVCYLFLWQDAVLGAAGFSASALQLKDRDAWIGWSAPQRRDHLDKVLCLSRFLIRPGVFCQNLASKVLGELAGRVGKDFAELYGYEPVLLETFVEREEHSGSSVRAAGWTRVGETAGRGRGDVRCEGGKSIKDIYLLALRKDFREVLGIAQPEAQCPLGVVEGLDASSWAEAEFGGSCLGDRRLSQRLVSIAETKARFPGLPFLQAVDGRQAEVRGYYRFLDQPRESEVQMDAIVQPHRQRTVRRIQEQREVLVVHDTTDLNYSTLLACEGLGIIGKNQTQTESGGLRLHSSYVLSAAEGLPLGLLDWKCYAPEPKPEHKGADRRHIPIEEKETYKWIENYQSCTESVEGLEGTLLVHVMDREGDFFELFDAWRNQGKGELIVRAKHDRRGSPKASNHEKVAQPSLFEQVRSLPCMETLAVTIPRKSARRKGKKVVAARKKRKATLELRWKEVLLYPPAHGVSQHKEPVKVWLLQAAESTAPEGENAIEWLLLSTRPILCAADAQRVISHYAKRWRIEDWHRILKTCCRVEEPAHEDAECLMRLIGINMVIAWRIHLMTLLGRETPDLPMELLFSEDEIDALNMVCDENRWAAPQTLGQGVLVVARLGGYMMRKHDPPPGAEVLWRGYKEISVISRVMAWQKLKKLKSRKKCV